MSITNYTELQTAVGVWLHRTDLAAMIPDFIMLAEQRMNGDLDARSMELTVALACVASTRTVALPADMLEMRRLLLTDADPVQVLEYKSPDQMIEDNPYLSATARPLNFTIVGPNAELSPTPDKAYPMELVYQQRIPPLSGSNTTNWLLQQNPSVYLFGALLAASPFTQDDARMPVYERKYQEGVETINGIDWYSGSTMRVRAR